MGLRRVVGGTAAAFALMVTPAAADFPYAAQGAPDDYTAYRLPAGANRTPDDLTGKLTWMYAATAAPDADPLTKLDPHELYGVRGAHLADAADVDQAWRTTTGRPDVVIAILDSGIKWDDRGAMLDDRRKTRLSRGETPVPQVDRTAAMEAGADCSDFHAAPGGDPRDLNRDGVFNVVDYACDSRVKPDPPKGVGPADLLDPQDVLIAFSDGTDADHNGYVDDIVGWDFLDDDNDPYDDVQYGHGTGESRDSTAEADNGGDVGACPNCMQIHLRVGTSFIADINRFAMAALYATDNGVSVIQEALGTLNKSRIAGDAIEYAFRHGVTVIASAADEAAQHHNWPSSFGRAIVVNSVTHTDEANGLPGPGSYLQLNGCTNFSSRITLAIPSVSCSSDATGHAAGMAGIVYSAALNAIDQHRLAPHPTCRRTDGSPCPVSAGEVRQLLASGIVNGTPVADDVDFATTELECPLPNCTDPFRAAPTTRVGTGISYPARKGHDQFYGYGRVNVNHAVDALNTGIPPEVELTAPDWFGMVDPAAKGFDVRGEVWARGKPYTCQVLVAPGSYPGEADFVAVPSPVCDGKTARTTRLDGQLADVSTADLKALFPPNAGDFTGRESGVTGLQPYGGRPDTEPYGFVVKVIAKAGPLTGQDRRQAYLHHDRALLPGFPRQLPGDGEASPVLADIDGDDQNELVIANSDGELHAFERDGGEVPGFPVRTGPLPDHPDARAYASGEVQRGHAGVLATPAVGDLDRDGVPEIVVADLEGAVTVFGADGTVLHRMRTNPAYSGAPLTPFVNVRHGHLNRVQHGFLGSPVLADLDGDGRLDIVAAAMDRHVYAWHEDGTALPGWPRLVVDRSKVASVDPVTDAVTFKDGAGADFQQGAIVDTPAVGDLDGDGKPEVVVGTNESYAEPLNAGGLDQALYAPLGAALSPANGRLFALHADGSLVSGWPFKVGILEAEVLPLVGEGITGSPVIGEVPCAGATPGVRVGTIPAAGLGYLVDPDGQSCYGRVNGLDRALPTTGGLAADPVFFPAFGHPAFATIAGQPVFLAPAAGVIRALDVVLPEYQGGRDYLVAWNTATGTVAPGWPAEMNDLQFLTGPSVADIDALSPGQEVLNGSANLDLQGFTGLGTDAGTAWPKLTGDWTVANPVVGTWGGGATKVVVSLTRSGRMLAYDTGVPACAPAGWPQFHHDPANSGDARRDAVPPGRPGSVTRDGSAVSFTAPGDDLRCGTADHYELQRPDGSTIKLDLSPKAAGTTQSATVGDGARLRAVDEQGNSGRWADIPAAPAPAAGPPTPATGGGTTTPPGACTDRLAPRSRITSRRANRRGIRLRGRSVERGGCGTKVRRVQVAIARPGQHRRRYRTARGTTRWSLAIRVHLRPGRYVARVRAQDAAGNLERARRTVLRVK